MNALLSTTYFGPVQWYQKLYHADDVQIEACESFQKQTYRNRCLIATTQGVQALTVPVRIEGSSLITNSRISDHGNWRHLHWNALKSAYGESPFFEYYEDDLRPFFLPDWEFLFDFNEAIRQKMCELLDIQPRVSPTTQFLPPAAVASHPTLHDFRDAIPLHTPPLLPGLPPEARLPTQPQHPRPADEHGARVRVLPVGVVFYFHSFSS